MFTCFVLFCFVCVCVCGVCVCSLPCKNNWIVDFCISKALLLFNFQCHLSKNHNLYISEYLKNYQDFIISKLNYRESLPFLIQFWQFHLSQSNTSCTLPIIHQKVTVLLFSKNVCYPLCFFDLSFCNIFFWIFEAEKQWFICFTYKVLFSSFLFFR